MSKERSRGIVGIFVVITLLFFVFLVFAFYTVSQLKKSSDSGFDYFKMSKNSPIAVITVEGAIMESKKTIEMLLEAERDKSIKAIILRIDSPGGAVAPTQEIYEEIRRIDSDKPIYASFGSMAASGGYYIGAATRKIYASPGTLTGSIGVIMQFADLSELFKFAKVKPETIKAGKYKDAGNPSRSITDEERRILNQLLMGTHERFVNDILEVRKDKVVGDIWQYAQGQIFHGEEAVKFGLVDELAGLYEAGRRIFKEFNFEGDFSLRFIEPKKKQFNLRAFLEDTEDTLSSIKGKIETQSLPLFMYRPNL